MISLAPERIYSTTQLLEALQSGVVGLKEQLQVLSILDGSASSWPGLSNALADLDSLVLLTVKHTSKLDSSRQQLEAENAHVQSQLASAMASLKSTTALRDQLQSSLDGQHQESRQLQRKLDAAELAAEKIKRHVWDLEKTRAELAEQAEKLKADTEFIEGELVGLKEQLAAQSAQLSSLREEVAVKTAELHHTSTALQEQKQSQAHLRNQLDRQLQQNKVALESAYQQLQTAQDSAAAQLKQMQDGFTGQIRQSHAELGAATDARQQAQATVAKLQQEVSTLVAELNQSKTEVGWLKEWQDVVKRVCDDRVAEAQQQVQAEKALAAQQAAAAASQLQGLQEKLQQKETESISLQRQIALMQAQLREAQRAGQAAADAQAAASSAIESQASEIAAVRQQLKEAEMLGERLKLDHAAALADTKGTAAAEQAELKGQVVDAVREAAVGRALIEGWQRDNKALQDKIQQLDAAVAAATSDVQTAHQAARQEQVATAAQTAAQVSAMHELQLELENSKAEAKRGRVEVASLTKQYEQSLQRLRREADAGAEEVERLRQAQSASASAAPTHISAGAQQLQQQPPISEQRASASNAAAAAPVSSEAEVSAHIQRELTQLRQYMHTVSGNLHAADAAMQIMAAAQCSKQSSPLVAPNNRMAMVTPERQQLPAALCLPDALAVLQQPQPRQVESAVQQQPAVATATPASHRFTGACNTQTLQVCTSPAQPTGGVLQASKGGTALQVRVHGAAAAGKKPLAVSAAAMTAGSLPAEPVTATAGVQPAAAAPGRPQVIGGGAEPVVKAESKTVANKKARGVVPVKKRNTTPKLS